MFSDMKFCYFCGSRLTVKIFLKITRDKFRTASGVHYRPSTVPFLVRPQKLCIHMCE